MFAAQVQPIEETNDHFDPGKDAAVDQRFELILIVQIVGRDDRLVRRFVRGERRGDRRLGRDVEDVTSSSRAKRRAMRSFAAALLQPKRRFTHFRAAPSIQFRLDVFQRLRLDRQRVFVVVLVDQHGRVIARRRLVLAERPETDVTLGNRRVRRG